MSLKPQNLAISALLRGSIQYAMILSCGVTCGAPPKLSASFVFRMVAYSIPAKQQHGGGADCLLAALFRNELLVLPQVFLRAFSVAQLFRVRLDKAEVDVLHRRVRDRRILKIPQGRLLEKVSRGA